MKTLAFQRDETKDRVTVDCADGKISVYSRCAYCRHCNGVRVGKRVIPTPQQQAFKGVKFSGSPDESLMNAAMMLNTLVRDGTAIECGDDAGEGFSPLYRY
jgi:hypothetical protein